MRSRLTFVLALAVAAFLIEATATAGPTGAGGVRVDARMILHAGACGTGVGKPCTMADGCPGITACQVDEIVCIYRGTGSIGCSACGQGGTRACTLQGPSSTCSVPNPTQVCNCNGSQTCNQVPNGAWSACSMPATQSCTNACGTGTQTCTNNVWSACTASASRGCNTGNGCMSTQVCANGTWGACNNGCQDGSPTTGCSTACGTTGSATCNANCTLKTACSAPETCNNCDDNNNGIVDDGLDCKPCDL